MKTRSLAVRVAVAVVTMLVVLVGVFRLIESPVSGDAATFTALFTDANGLRLGDDVRLYGVRVGKVRDVELDGNNLARVQFTVTTNHPLFDGSRIAIKYQNLTGYRYLEIQQPDQLGKRRDPKAVFQPAETVPSFDITTLFRGLQPVLAELSPDDLNRFATSMLAVIQGDGTGLGPALGSIETLSRYASDRQTLISTLVTNLGQISDHLGGKSGDAMKLLQNLTSLFVTITDKLPGLVDFSATIPPVLHPFQDLVSVLGITGQPNRDLDAALRQAFPDPDDAVSVFDRLPGLIQQLTAAIPATGPNADLTCTDGATTAPAPLQLLIAGQRIVICHR